MINAGNFFALARAQFGRTIGERCQDLVLCSLLPDSHHPTSRGEVHRLAERFVPEEQRFRFYVAAAYFARSQVELLVDVWADDELMEARARMVDAGAVTAPTDAPCRELGWPVVARLLRQDNERSADVLRRFLPVLGDRYTAGLLADARDILDKVGITHEETGAVLRDSRYVVGDLAHRGLAWVAGSSALAAGPETSELAMRHLLYEWRRHWPHTAPPWTADLLIAWAEVCARYVEARR